MHDPKETHIRETGRHLRSLLVLGLLLGACGADDERTLLELDAPSEVSDAGTSSGRPDAGAPFDVGTGVADAGVDDAGDLQGGQQPPFQELFDQGIDQYLGRFTPSSTTNTRTGVTDHVFSGENRGPTCFTGQPFQMATRPGRGDTLMIFLQGGGACTPDGCEAVERGLPLVQFGVLDNRDAMNPAAQFDVGYLPYCDGSLWGGDRDVDNDGDGVADRLFRGLQNLSASLDVIKREFPSPRRIFIAGNSAGGFGAHMALPLVRRLYPGIPIDLVNDSGVGIFAVGAPETIFPYWNSTPFFPASCSDCIGEDGNLTGYQAYQLAEDPDLRVGMMSTKRDSTIVDASGFDGAQFEAELLEAVAELSAAFPSRFRSFIANGDGHTFILRDFDRAVGGTTVRDWIAALLEGGDAWVSVAE